MRVALVLPLLAGCNALFGLDETHGPGGDDDVVAPDADTSGVPDAFPGPTGSIGALDIDYIASGTGAMRGWQATAQFGDPPETCTALAAAGKCVASFCTGAQVPLPAPNSGVISIEGDLHYLSDLTPDSGGTYPKRAGTDSGFFTAGVTVGILTTGAEVPSLNVNLVAPSLVSIVSGQVPSPTAPVVVVRSVGMELAWGSNANGVIELFINDSFGHRVTCSMEAEDGSGTVPGAVLEQLSAGEGTFEGYSTASSNVISGDYQVLVKIAHNLRRADGDMAAGTIQLQ